MISCLLGDHIISILYGIILSIYCEPLIIIDYYFYMFTRSQSRAITNPSDSGSAIQPSKVEKKKPGEKFMGMRLRGKANQNKYKNHD